MTNLKTDDGAIAPAALDEVVPFQVDALDTRGRAVQIGPALTAILNRHDYPEAVARLLGEMTVLTVLLGTSLKFEGKLILQTQTKGPVSLLVVDFVTPDALRAYARFDADMVADAIKQGSTSPEDMLGKGLLALTVDQGQYMSRYQGMVQLDGSSLEAIAHNYFKQSEQIPTEVRLSVGKLSERDEAGEVQTTWRAGGMLAQFLPESEDRIRQRDLHPGEAPEGASIIENELSDDDAWTELKALMGTLSDEELLDDELGSHGLLYRLFHERGVRVYDGQAIKDECSCSQEKVLDVLTALTPEQQAESVQEGKISITCEFCSKHYSFAPDDPLLKAK